MLKAVIDTDTFREMIDVIAAMVNECRMHISADGFKMIAVDTANVAMVSLNLKTEAFSSFSASDDVIGLDITKMKNIVGLMGKGDELTLELPDGAGKMEMSFGGYKYSLSLLDVNTIRKDPNPPTIDLPGKVVLKGAELNSAIKGASLVSDKIALGIKPDAGTFYLEAEGDTDHINLELGSDQLESLTAAEARSLFSLDYLREMGKVLNRADQVTISIGIDHPVKLSFDVADGNGHVEYLLAPRIEAD
jgi:proliferating cell nuclear antigen